MFPSGRSLPTRRLALQRGVAALGAALGATADVRAAQANLRSPARVARVARGEADTRPRSVTRIPRGYAHVARQHGVPAAVLFCVACQESVMRFGERYLPHPWTLCVRGQGQRFASYGEAVAALQGVLASGITNVDCGAMQVNWHWHRERLLNPHAALDPYPNLRIGASLLAEHHAACGDWFVAVGRYHHPSDRVRAQNYASGVFRRIERLAAAARPQTAFAGSVHA